MKRSFIVTGTLAIFLCVIVVSGVTADPIIQNLWDDGTRLDDEEMAMVSGRLHVFGTQILPRLKRFFRKQRTVDPSREHCDVIAQNRADELGLNTSDQNGNSVDYNSVKVSTIYGGYPSDRNSQPPEGTSGYYFSSYGGEKEHMGTYSRPAGSSSYTRYMNRSFAGTETAARVPVGYSAPGSTSQSFVPLPRYESGELYYR
ncbi:MAG: hypothetical protein HN368_06805 [Spirochaetales bacterium]|nr:hypothetical protein [Spirochaetales bacterium]